MARVDGMRLVSGRRGRSPERAFEHAYRDSYPLVYNYVFRRMPNREASEDVVAEAFMRAARYFDRFDESRAKFSTWVISIARNCISDYYEHNVASASLDDVPEGAYAEDDERDARLIDDELVRQLLAVLDDEERELIALKYYEGRRNVEIAQELGMNPSTVSTKLARTIAKMRAAVA